MMMSLQIKKMTVKINNNLKENIIRIKQRIKIIIIIKKKIIIFNQKMINMLKKNFLKILNKINLEIKMINM